MSIQIDPIRIFYQAEAFSATSKLLNDQIQLEHKEIYYFPEIVNAAFALELYLKCLLVLESTRFPTGRDGHNLIKLFNAVSPASQQEIKKLYNDLLVANPHVEAREKYQAGAGYVKSVLDIENVLTEAESAFADFRYAFEGLRAKAYHGPALFYIRKAIRERIVELRPDFISKAPGLAVDAKAKQIKSAAFDRDIKSRPANVINGGFEYPCSRCGTKYFITYNLIPGEPRLVVPNLPSYLTPIEWPKDDELVCSICGRQININEFRKTIEEHTGRKIL